MTDEVRPTEMTQQLTAFRNRKTDRGWLCWIAVRAADMWDWVDKRDIDKHIITGWTLYMSSRVTFWAMAFAEAHPTMPGLEIAAIVGAVTGIVALMAGAVIKFHFTARTD
jgi:hypothetical protein